LGTSKETERPSKGRSNKDVFEKALADYYLVRLSVVCDREVVLPDHIKTPAWLDRKAVLCLEYGLDMAVPISDMVVTDEGVAATLSFSRTPYPTFVPWKSVVGFTWDGERPPIPKSKPKLGLVK
jgi:hypothetical protein